MKFEQAWPLLKQSSSLTAKRAYMEDEYLFVASMPADVPEDLTVDILPVIIKVTNGVSARYSPNQEDMEADDWILS